MFYIIPFIANKAYDLNLKPELLLYPMIFSGVFGLLLKSLKNYKQTINSTICYSIQACSVYFLVQGKTDFGLYLAIFSMVINATDAEEKDILVNYAESAFLPAVIIFTSLNIKIDTPVISNILAMLYLISISYIFHLKKRTTYFPIVMIILSTVAHPYLTIASVIAIAIAVFSDIKIPEPNIRRSSRYLILAVATIFLLSQKV
jgi:hypothetical protein